MSHRHTEVRWLNVRMPGVGEPNRPYWGPPDPGQLAPGKVGPPRGSGRREKAGEEKGWMEADPRRSSSLPSLEEGVSGGGATRGCLWGREQLAEHVW